MSTLLFRGIPQEPPASRWSPASPAVRRPIRPPHQPSLLARMRAAWRRRRSRVVLSQLDDFMLKDIGLTRADAEHEANKPFWQL